MSTARNTVNNNEQENIHVNEEKVQNVTDFIYLQALTSDNYGINKYQKKAAHT